MRQLIALIFVLLVTMSLHAQEANEPSVSIVSLPAVNNPGSEPAVTPSDLTGFEWEFEKDNAGWPSI